jgi:hypothetical protein
MQSATVLLLVSVGILSVSFAAAAAPTQFACDRLSLVVTAGQRFPDGLELSVSAGCSVRVAGVAAPFIRLVASGSLAGSTTTVSIRDVLFTVDAAQLAAGAPIAANIEFVGGDWVADVSVENVAARWSLPAAYGGGGVVLLLAGTPGGGGGGAASLTFSQLFVLNATLALLDAASGPRDVSLFAVTAGATLSMSSNALVRDSVVRVAEGVAAGAVNAALVHVSARALLNAPSGLTVIASSVVAFARSVAVAQLLRIDGGGALASTAARVSGGALVLAPPTAWAPGQATPVPLAAAPVAALASFCGGGGGGSVGACSNATPAGAGPFAAPSRGTLSFSNVVVVLAPAAAIGASPATPPPAAPSSPRDAIGGYACFAFRTGAASFPPSGTATFEVVGVAVREVATLPASLTSATATSPAIVSASDGAAATALARVFSQVSVAAGARATFQLTGGLWACQPTADDARAALRAPGSGTIASAGCESAASDASAGSSEFERATVAFFLSAFLSAASMSTVAFGLTRSQEVSQFTSLAAQGNCISRNASVAPAFAESFLGLRLSDEWCGYYGGAVAGNLLIVVCALSAAVIFGVVGCCVKRRALTVHRVQRGGFFYAVLMMCIGLFQAPSIQNGALCAIRAEGSLAARVVFGLTALVLFAAPPALIYVVLVRSRITRFGAMVKERRTASSMLRRALGRAWDVLFGAREWQCKAASALLAEGLLQASDAPPAEPQPTTTAAGATPQATASGREAPSAPSGRDAQSVSALAAGMSPSQPALAVTDAAKPARVATLPEAMSSVFERDDASGGDDDTALHFQRFYALLPLFDDYAEERFPTFTIVEVVSNSAIALPALLAEAYADATSRSCWLYGILLVAVFLVYWLMLTWFRPVECRSMLLTLWLVSGLQLLLVAIGVAVITVGANAPAWADGIGVALIIAQTTLSLVGIAFSLRYAFTGGLQRMRRCLCPREVDAAEEDAEAVLAEADASHEGPDNFLAATLINEMGLVAATQQQQPPQQPHQKQAFAPPVVTATAAAPKCGGDEKSTGSVSPVSGGRTPAPPPLTAGTAPCAIVVSEPLDDSSLL